VSADIDERTLREIYLAAFEHVVTTQQPTTVMCSYNKINGTYSSQNRWLLTDLLRGEWGFEGLVVSDWGAVNDPVAAVAAGLDLEMPPSGAESEIAAAVRAGTLDEAALDVAVDRLLTLLDRTRDALAGADGAGDPPLDTAAYDAHHALAREVARECAVLLENDGTLPLDPSSAERIAVVGAFAADPRYQGAGSSQVVPTRLDDALTAIREAAGADRVTFAPGFRLSDGSGRSDGTAGAAGTEKSLHDEAVAAAREADVVIAFLGLPGAAESEGYDRTTLSLPDDQLVLLEALQGVSDRVVVVLSNGSAVSVAEWRDGIAAILEGWLLGQAGGAATADLLFGAASPSGRLTETLPIRLEDTPAYLNFPGGDGHVLYGEGVHVGYRYYDTLDVPVVYPFGHGFTYTTFAYGDVRAEPAPGRGDNSWDVHVTVTNTGDRAGAEVVQVYVHDVEARVARPRHELRGFSRVSLEPGESADVVVPLDDRAFAFWSVKEGRWEIEAGEFVIEVGASSRDIRGTVTVTSPGDGIGHRLDATSTLGEWLSDDVGAQVLGAALAAAGEAAEAAGASGDGADSGDGSGAPDLMGSMLGDGAMGEMAKQMPIGKIASFTGMVTRDQLDQLVAAYEAARGQGV
jgi:beta-glucosidase